ncbi:MAG TPA: SGNH/GDSL hydrolase family protein [Elusimicrobiota bacterium]|nr:SGNH/GDSL hydrolase family protein [Elusimicrobiota bacterium]
MYVVALRRVRRFIAWGSKAVLKTLLVLVIAEGVLWATGHLYLWYYTKFAWKPADLSPGIRRILFIGESTVEGQRCDEGDFKGPFPAQLEAMLNRMSGRNEFSCINHGISGVTSAHMLRYIGKDLVDYAPEIVVLQAGMNMNMPSIFRLIRRAGWDIEVDSVVLAKLHRLRIVRFGKLFYEMGRAGDLDPIHYYEDLELENAENKANIQTVIDKIKKYGARVVICNYFKEGYANDILKGVVRENGLILCDNAAVFKEWQRRGVDRTIISSDGWHPNGNGYRLIACNLLKTFLEKDLVPYAVEPSKAERIKNLEAVLEGNLAAEI